MGRKRQEGLKLKQTVRDELVRGEGIPEGTPDWTTPCQICDEVPTCHPTRLCGPCCFGDAHTAGGNW